MPLVVCPDCGRNVSDLASACPGCGRPVASFGDAAVEVKIAVAAPAPSVAAAPRETRGDSVGYEFVMLAPGLVGGVIAAAGTMGSLDAVAALVTVGMSVLVVVVDGIRRRDSAWVGYAFGSLMLWIIVFPLYLYRRTEGRSKLWFVLGLLSLGLLAGGAGISALRG